MEEQTCETGQPHATAEQRVILRLLSAWWPTKQGTWRRTGHDELMYGDEIEAIENARSAASSGGDDARA